MEKRVGEGQPELKRGRREREMWEEEQRRGSERQRGEGSGEI